MANIRGTSLGLVQTVFDDATLEIEGAGGVATAVLNGVTHVYVSGYDDDGVQVFTMDAAGMLTAVASIADTSGLNELYLSNPQYLHTFSANGSQYLAVTGIYDDGISVFELSDSMPYLTESYSVGQTNNPAFNLDDPWDIDTVMTGGKTFMYVSGRDSNGISVFEVDGTGSLIGVQNLDDDGSTRLNGAAGVAAFEAEGNKYLAVTSITDNALSIFSINSTTGQLTFVDDIANNTSLAGLSDVQVKEINGRTFLYGAARGGDGIGFFEFDAGQPNLLFRGALSGSELGEPRQLELIEVGDRLLVAIGGADSDTLVIFDVETGALVGLPGVLTLSEVLEDGTGRGDLDYPEQMASVEVDGTTYLIVTAYESSAVNVYEVGGGDDVLEGTNNADTMNGGSGDDMLFGRAGVDQMSGESGDDTLHGGSDGDGIAGNAGDDTLYGESGADYLYGGDGSDILRGGSDGDFLYGDGLRDQLDGGSGADFINGGADYDWMWGNQGADLFHFSGYNFHDFIMDFVDGEDKISLQGEGWGYTSTTGPGATAGGGTLSIFDDGNGNAFISLGYQTWITVYNISAAQLTDADFVF